MSEYSRNELAAGAEELGLDAAQRRDVLNARPDEGSAARQLLATVGRIGRRLLSGKAARQPWVTTHAEISVRDVADEMLPDPPPPPGYFGGYGMTGFIPDSGGRYPDPPPMTADELAELRRLTYPLAIDCRKCGAWTEGVP